MRALLVSPPNEFYFCDATFSTFAEMHQSSIFGFFISRYKYTPLERNYQVVLRTGDFVDFIGFDKAIVKKVSNGTKLPNIT